mgnify:CR=1 FL=1
MLVPHPAQRPADVEDVVDCEPVQHRSPVHRIEVVGIAAPVDIDRSSIPIDRLLVKLIFGQVSLSESLEPITFPSGSISSSMRELAQSR